MKTAVLRLLPHQHPPQWLGALLLCCALGSAALPCSAVASDTRASDAVARDADATAQVESSPQAAQPQQRSDDDFYSIRVDDTFVQVRTGPGRGYPVFYVVERGEIIHLHKQRTQWIKISDKWQRRSGWVKRDHLNNSLAVDGSLLQFSEPGWDNYQASRWESGVALGDFNGAESLTLNVGYRLTRNLSTEVRISQSTGQFSDNTLINAAILHQPFPGWRVSPFFMLGAGVISTEPHATLVQTEDRSDSAMLVGAGAYVYLSRRFVMRLEYNNHLLLTSRDENEEINEWKLGFNVFF